MTRVLERAQWTALEAAHAARVDVLTAAHRARRGRRVKHPVEDFLFEYYTFSPAKLRRWHPGPAVVLAEAAGMPRASWRCYRTTDGGGLEFDADRFVAERGRTVAFVRSLLSATLSRPAFSGCFGMHEWAMVYRLEPEQVRHTAYPLRLGEAGTDAVLEAHALRCSHFDAVRFFTPPAVSRNAVQPQRDSQIALEQPGCLHAGMDVYKWAHKLTPLVPSELVGDAFELAREIRTLDMQASPYDLTSLGYAPVAVETPEGKTEYAARQRAFAQRTNALRIRLVAVLDLISGVERHPPSA